MDREHRQERLHKLAVILYRRNRGDTVESIANYLHCSKPWIYEQLMVAGHNADIKYEAKLMMVSGERQRMFEFMYEPL